MKRTRLEVGVAVVALGAYGCAGTMYTPRADGRISVTSSGLTRQFTKNGTSLTATMDNLQLMVADNPAAAEQARQAASDSGLGLVLDLGGLAATIAGAVVIAPGNNPNGTTRPVSDGRLAAGGAIVLAGLISIGAALWYLSSGQARQLDAINIYNDGVRPWPPSGATGLPPVVSPVPLAPPANPAPAPTPLPPPPVSPLPPPEAVPQAPAPAQ